MNRRVVANRVCACAAGLLLAHEPAEAPHHGYPKSSAITAPFINFLSDHVHDEIAEGNFRDRRTAVGPTGARSVHGGRLRFAFELFDDEPRPTWPLRRWHVENQ